MSTQACFIGHSGAGPSHCCHVECPDLFCFVCWSGHCQSDVVALDMTSEPPRELLRIKGVGTKAHGLVEWGSKLIMLDSDAGTLVQLDPYTSNVDDIWAVPEGGKFLKGLAVIDDTAYFGINVWSQRSERDDPETAEELAAVDLIQRRLVWRRRVATKGLLNIVSAPHLGEESTYR